MSYAAAGQAAAVDMFARLDAGVRMTLATAYAARSAGPLGTAIRSLATFAQCVPNRILFKMPRWHGDLTAEAHNEWTLLLWVWWLLHRDSPKTGKPIQASSIEQRVSLAKGLLSFRYGFQLAGAAPRLSQFFKRIRETRAAATRRKRRGIRRRHLMKLWSRHSAIRASTKRARSEWAAETCAWHMLARGGELESITKDDLSFGRSSGTGRRYAVIWLRPLKKKGGAAQPKLPQFIQEQRRPQEWEPYRALQRLAESIADEPGTAPLFTAARGAKMSTGKFRALNKRYAKLLGWNPKEAGAHTPRIGGATEYGASGSVSELLLQARGRWSSDIAAIYARMTRRAHLAASDLMFEAHGRDLEEIMPTFVQPA